MYAIVDFCFFFKQKTAYEMRISDWSSDVCSSDLDPAFKAEMDYLLKDYVGRPSPLYYAEPFTKHLGGAKIYFKREELNHTGAHKINNCIGQILLAKRDRKSTRLNSSP